VPSLGMLSGEKTLTSSAEANPEPNSPV